MVALDVSGLRGIVEYDPAELTLTARAGTPVAELDAALAEHGQYLPFDPPLAAAGATIGGVIAAGTSGPGALRYGPSATSSSACGSWTARARWSPAAGGSSRTPRALTCRS